MSDGPMNHLECREELGAVIDGAAGQSERTAVSAHLAACAQCRAYEHKLRSLWGILAKEAKLSANFDQRFLAQLAQQRPNRLRDVMRAKWWAPLLAGSFAAVLAVLGTGRRGGLNEEQLFIADNQEMLAQLEVVKTLDATADLDDADFAIVQALPALEKAD